MGKVFPLTKYQIKMVEENISVIQSVIHSRIIADNRKIGLETEDLFQEGCLLLCRAAQKYDKRKNASFRSFAYKVVANGLISHCKRVNQKNKYQAALPENYENMFISAEYDLEEQVIKSDLLAFLEKTKRQYTGTVKLGIEVLIFKVKGYSGAEIARMYGVKPNLIGARQARALQKLEGNTVFHTYMEELFSA